MPNEVEKANAGAEDSPVEKSNITPSEFASLRIGKKAAPEREKPDAGKSNPEAKPTDESEAKESKDKEVKAEPKDVPSKEIDLESMSETELRELADKLGSRAVARFGELTAKRKAAEEQLVALRQELASRQMPQIDPLADNKPKPNPYANIKSLQELQAKAKEVDEVIEWAEETLWNNDGSMSDDVVATVDGRDLTKAQVRKALRDAQKARKEHLPAQLTQLQAAEGRKAIRAQLEATARQELPWIEKDGDEVKQKYIALSSSPLLQKAREAVPELEPYLEYVVAHAANSIYGRKSIQIDEPTAIKAKPQINPPSNPKPSSAASEKSENRDERRESESRKRLSETNSVSDFIALRTAQFSKRKPIN